MSMKVSLLPYYVHYFTKTLEPASVENKQKKQNKTHTKNKAKT